MQNLIHIQIGNGIRNIREEYNYTQEYLAEELGITQRAYSDIERGKSKLTLERFIKIAGIFQVSTNRLLAIDPTNQFDEEQTFDRSAYKRQVDDLQSEVHFLKGIISDYRSRMNGDSMMHVM